MGYVNASMHNLAASRSSISWRAIVVAWCVLLQMHFIFIRCLKVYASEGSKLWVNHYFSLLNGVFSICCILRPDLLAPLSVIPQLKGGEGLRKTVKCKTWKSTRSCTKIRKAKEGDDRALNCKKNE